MELKNIKKDKIFLVLLIIIVCLGIFIRFNDFSEVGYMNDDQAHIPAGLMWFYPHDYFPGLNYGNPPLGDIMIGLGCKLSGEDFSGVSQVQPFFYPNRPALLPNLAKEKVDMFCHLPMYIFGLIFFIIIIIFALTFFEKYSALFLISLFAFYNPLLAFSRWTKPDVVLWVFIILGLFFLLKAYQENKFKRELIFSLLFFSFFALALATKFTAGIFLLFAIFILLIKHKPEVLTILKKLNLAILNKLQVQPHKKQLLKILIPCLIVFSIVVLIPFKFSLKNFFATYNSYQQMNQQLGSISINPINIFNFFKETLIILNIIDLLILLFAIYVFIRIIFQKNKTKLEIFVIYLAILGLIAALLFPVIGAPSRAFPFFFGIFALMAFSFSNRNYSIFSLFKIKRKRLFFIIFIIIYLILSFTIALSASPYFQVKNPLICPLTKGKCTINLNGFDTKDTANYLKNNLNEDETFLGQGGAIFFYLRQEQEMQNFNFDQAFLKQFSKSPTLKEKLKFFKPDNQTIRYLLINPNRYSEEEAVFINNYKPNHKIILNKKDTILIYDLESLKQNV